MRVSLWSDFLIILSGITCLMASAEYYLSFDFPWPIDLVANFQIQALVLGLLLLPWTLARKKKLLVAYALVYQLLSLYALWPYLNYFGKPHIVTAEDKQLEEPLLRVAAANIHFLNPISRDFAEAIQAISADIFVLLEVSKRNETRIKEVFSAYPHSMLGARDDAFGMAVFSRLPLREETISGGAKGFLRSLQIETANGTLQVIAVHTLPPISRDWSKRRDHAIKAIPDLIAKDTPVLVIGDFNITPWMSEFVGMAIAGTLAECRLGRGIEATWPANFTVIPIDHCLTNPMVQAEHFSLFRVPGSDHLGLIADVKKLRRASQGEKNHS